jgi:protocatechuate 3,4-dioxygenase, beta subunit
MANYEKISHSGFTRRGLVALIGVLSLDLFRSRPAWALQTPSSTEGPFYPTPAMRFEDADNNLVRIAGQVETAGGEIFVLRGRVLDGAGNAAPGARVEIWQCDVNGRYLHTGDRRGPARDSAFQGFGHVVTGSDGQYAFRTIKPVPYTGRTPHIHVKVIHTGRELTTQFYIAGHPQNANDFLFQRMNAEQREAVSMVFSDGAEGTEAVVDIVV